MEMLIPGLIVVACGIAWHSWKTVMVGVALGCPLNLYFFLGPLSTEHLHWTFLIPLLQLAIVCFLSENQQRVAWSLWGGVVGLVGAGISGILSP
jgi:uncharacterized oligopeptide transporter (OPT) family protein